MGLLDSAFGGILGAIQLAQAGKIHPQYNAYTPSPYAKDTLSTAQNAYNGRMAGAPALERNIITNQANTDANIDRSATDGSQVLAAKAGTQGQTNQAFEHLQTQEAQNKYQLLNNLNLANAGMTTEGDKKYQADLQKYQMDYQAQAALRQSGITNLFGAVNGLGTSAMMGSMMSGMSGGSTSQSGQGGKGGLESMLPLLMMLG